MAEVESEPKVTLGDKVMEVLYGPALEKPLPEDYFTRDQESLPVVSEAREAVNTLRQDGKLIEANRQIKSDKTVFYFFSDIHLPGADLEYSTIERHRLFAPIEKTGTQTRKAEKRNIKPEGRSNELAWTRSIRPMVSVDAARSIMDSISLDIKQQTADSKKELSAVIFDNGDTDSPESTMSDVALSTVNFAEAVERIQNPENPNLNVLAGRSLGNHDADPHNKGIEAEIFQRELWGSQISRIDVTEGEHTVTVISVNTNLESSFWNKHYMARLDGEKKASGLSERYNKLAKQVAEEKKRQRDLLTKLSLIDNPVVIVGHDGEILKNMLPEDLENTNVVCLITAHTHKPKDALLKIKSKKGFIREITTAPALRGTPGSEKITAPSVTVMEIEPDSDQPIKFRQITVEVQSDALV